MSSPYANYDPTKAIVQADPYPYYAYLREHEPVKYIPEMNAYAVSRHSDVQAVLRNHEQFSSGPLIQLAFGDFNPAPDSPYLLASDPPDHTRLRNLVNKAFSKRMLDSKRTEIVAIVKQLLDEASENEEFDVIEEFSSPLPVHIIGQIMGIETEMRADFRRWSNNVTAGGNAAALTDAQRAEMRQDTEDFRDYFLKRIAEVRKKPEANLISDLVQAEEAGDKLTADEVLAMCVLLLIAGNETTTSLISNAIICLRDFPEQEKIARADRSLVPNMTEEVLRYLSPIQFLFRQSISETQVAGVTIPKDATVLAMYASANRDESVFKNADQLDVRRENLRQHTAFGWGIHMCVGRALGLLEGELALNHMFDRFKTIEITQEKIEWCDAFYLRGPKNLKIRCR
ncbi:MAG: cytochrome P450 [Zhongshania sp.]|uniref:cytochrome P450 n=1 Tax=Zhongshania sp. TaxID=1971902 RepID=UPI00262286E6|nr:cytochrome P450 [Zhongshania sp.]MDF1693132.1 cytochrome P450 [Zhongshania sp.]